MDKIICLGKNYLEHAKELGDAIPERPVIFLKPPSVLLMSMMGKTLTVALPKTDSSIHHECELVVRLGALNCIEAVSVGLDMTLRDLQSKLKKAGHPWTTAKVFPGSAIVGPFLEVSEFVDYAQTPFSLSIDGQERQSATAQEMLLSITESISYISRFFTLQKGDLIFTGTPKGVGPVTQGTKAQLKFGKIHYGVEWQ